LLSTYTILSKILLSRFTLYADEIIGENKCGFGHSRSNTDHIFCIRLKNGITILENIVGTFVYRVKYSLNFTKVRKVTVPGIVRLRIPCEQRREEMIFKLTIS
jgi:hypothetical protein